MTNRPSYSTLEVAKRLNVSIQTVQRWVDAGHLQAWKTLGGHRRIDAESAERLFSAQAPGAPEGAAAPSPELSVLVVDDNAQDRSLLRYLAGIALPQAEVITADNGFHALVLIGQRAPQIVVTDIVMPAMDGFALLRFLCAGERPPEVIAVSSCSEDDVQRRGHLPPGVPFIGKPLERHRFTDALRQAAAATGG